MKIRLIVIGLGFLLPMSTFAASNVQLIVSKVSAVHFVDRALNHATYMETTLAGTVTQSDSVVAGLPTPLPQTVRLLFRPANALDSNLFKSCEKMALLAKNDQTLTLIVHLFMDTPNNLPNKIEGGMSDSQFNQFVITADDTEISSIRCSLQ
ncbi:hypothetical protein WDW86_11995 [Bdellovibrionota bacterium FG-2]